MAKQGLIPPVIKVGNLNFLRTYFAEKTFQFGYNRKTTYRKFRCVVLFGQVHRKMNGTYAMITERYELSILSELFAFFNVYGIERIKLV